MSIGSVEGSVMNHPSSKNDLLSTANPSSMLNRFQTLATASPRRTTHGGCAWSLPSRDQNLALRQPQDGSLTSPCQSVASSMLSALRAKATNLAATHAHDDKLSGATRSLSSRILGLNGMKTQYKPAMDTDSERYFAEASVVIPAGLARQPSPRKGPIASAKFAGISGQQTKLA